jgi:hypothetical protein
VLEVPEEPQRKRKHEAVESAQDIASRLAKRVKVAPAKKDVGSFVLEEGGSRKSKEEKKEHRRSKEDKKEKKDKHKRKSKE